MRACVFLNSSPEQCGVHEYGRRVGKCLAEGGRGYRWVYHAGNCPTAALGVIKEAGDVACVVANWAPATLPWFTPAWMHAAAEEQHARTGRTIRFLTVTHDHICPHHTVSSHVHPDPMMEEWPGHFRVVRLVTPLADPGPAPDVPIVGSFGFALGGKRFDEVLRHAQESWPGKFRARFHLPAATHGDPGGMAARVWAEKVRHLGDGTQAVFSFGWLDEPDLMRWLAGNSINVFCYERMYGRGISSVLDYALGAGRPVAVTDSWMFRHVTDARPRIVLGYGRKLRDVQEAGLEPLQPMISAWDAPAVVRDYERACAATEAPESL